MPIKPIEKKAEIAAKPMHTSYSLKVDGFDYGNLLTDAEARLRANAAWGAGAREVILIREERYIEAVKRR